MSGSELKADFWVSEYITPWDIYVHGITKVLVYKKPPIKICMWSKPGPMEKP